MYNLYKYDKDINQLSIIPSVDGYKKDVFKLSIRTIFRNNKPFTNIYWLLNTFGKCWVYSIYKDSQIIHYSYVTKRCYKFPFMRNDDIQIGNCYTKVGFRGKKIYPFVVQEVINDFDMKNNSHDVYMLIDQENSSSRKAMQSIGFRVVQQVETKKYLKFVKIYRIIN